MSWSPTDEKESAFSFSYLPILNFLCIVVLCIGVVILGSSHFDQRHEMRKATHRLILKETTSQPTLYPPIHSYPFHISSPERTQRIPSRGTLPNMNYDCIIYYTVCCHTSDGDFFVCHSVTKNIGVEAVIERGGHATIIVQHSDMYGAQCILKWEQKVNCESRQNHTMEGKRKMVWKKLT